MQNGTRAWRPAFLFGVREPGSTSSWRSWRLRFHPAFSCPGFQPQSTGETRNFLQEKRRPRRKRGVYSETTDCTKGTEGL